MLNKRALLIFLAFISIVILGFLYRQHLAETRFNNMIKIIDICTAKGEVIYKHQHSETCIYEKMKESCKLSSKQEEGLKKIKDTYINTCVSEY